jgi:protein-S-isoprenylcysteine O-methyltransferase Ste14
MKRVLPPRAFLLALLAMAALHFFLPLEKWNGNTLTAVTAALLLGAGLTLTIGQARRFDRVKANIKTFDPPTALIKDGPYRFSRNPMYLGFVLTLLGVWFLLLSAGALLPVLAFASACNFIYIPFEEREMLRVHGGAYDDYRQTVRRWL